MQIKEICDKYGIDGVYERFASSCEDKIEVGFLGEFSSGKSSLLNSLLGQDLLATASKPTTKTVLRLRAAATSRLARMNLSRFKPKAQSLV